MRASVSCLHQWPTSLALTVALLLPALGASGCQKKTSAPAGPTRTVTLYLSGMTCGGCVQTLTQAFQNVPGAKKVTVTLRPPRAQIAYDASRAKPADFVKAAQKAGYGASLEPPARARPRAEPARPRARRETAAGPARPNVEAKAPAPRGR